MFDSRWVHSVHRREELCSEAKKSAALRELVSSRGVQELKVPDENESESTVNLSIKKFTNHTQSNETRR